MCIYTACKLCPLSIVTPSLPWDHHPSTTAAETFNLALGDCVEQMRAIPPELEHKLLQHCCLCSCKNTNPTTHTNVHPQILTIYAHQGTWANYRMDLHTPIPPNGGAAAQPEWLQEWEDVYLSSHHPLSKASLSVSRCSCCCCSWVSSDWLDKLDTEIQFMLYTRVGHPSLSSAWTISYRSRSIM